MMDKSIDIEEIMKEIRKNIEERGYDREPLSFDEVQMSEPAADIKEKYDPNLLAYEFNYINHNWDNSLQTVVTARNPFIMAVKKLIRKAVTFVLLPIVNYQNAYNLSNAKCMNQIKQYILEMDEYKKRLKELETELAELKKQNSKG